MLPQLSTMQLSLFLFSCAMTIFSIYKFLEKDKRPQVKPLIKWGVLVILFYLTALATLNMASFNALTKPKVFKLEIGSGD